MKMDPLFANERFDFDVFHNLDENRLIELDPNVQKSNQLSRLRRHPQVRVRKKVIFERIFSFFSKVFR